jgi:hypothetical protein
MASIISAGTTSGTALNMTADTSGQLQLATGSSPTTAVSIDSSQNVTLNNVIPSGSTAPTNGMFLPAANSIGLSTASTERMRIDSSGNVLVGVTSPGSYVGGSAIGTIGYINRSGAGGSFSNNRFNYYWTGSSLQAWIDTSNVGNVTLTSDYRIKKNIETNTTQALERIAQIRPVTYELTDYKELFKADGVAREGFIAHELAEVIPSAVEGEKDAENQIQSLKLDALCSVMVKAIQEQQTIITQLQSDITALKAKVGV